MRGRRRYLGDCIRGCLVWAFVAIVFLSLVEGTFQAANIAPPPPVFVENPFSEAEACIVNPAFYYQFISSLVGTPSPEGFGLWGFSIPREKAPGVYRIVVLGGSAAFGWPTPEYGFHAILETMLESAFPTTTFEVYNLACPVLNAYVMRKVADACSELDPDLFIVYMGNNEFDGPFGPAWHQGGFFANTIQQPLLRFSREIRILRWVSALVGQRGAKEPQEADPLQYFENLSLVSHESLSRKTMHRRFGRYLDSICHAAARANARVVVSTVGSNLRDWAPFASRYSPGLSPSALEAAEELYSEGRRHEEAGAMVEARAAFEAAAAIDPGYAALQFRLGKCYLDSGEKGRALEAFEKARDYDCYPYRADSTLNTIIRQTPARGAGQGIFLADAESRMHVACADSIAGNGIFYDNVHLLFEGNHVIAAALFELVVSDLQSQGHRGGETNEALSIEQCRERLGLGAYEYRRHLEAVMNDYETYKKMKSYQESLSQNETSWIEEKIRTLSESEEGRPEEARALLEKAIAGDEKNFYLHQSLARLLLRMEDHDAAREYVERLSVTFRDRPDAHLLHARLLEEMGFHAEATLVLEPLEKLLR